MLIGAVDPERDIGDIAPPESGLEIRENATLEARGMMTTKCS